jgi:25S rRNA (uracil2634-N3)-methyltransferase
METSSQGGRVKDAVRRRPHQKRRATPAAVATVVADKEEEEEQASAAISTTSAPPQRDASHLYVNPATWKCATTQSGKACLVCAYKIGCFDVALDTAFTTTVPNARPESCPRLVVQQQQQLPSRTSRDDDEVDDEEEVVSPCASWPTGAKSSAAPRRILTVGDGDFSYSVALARRLAADGGGAATGLVATSYESRATLEKVYPRFAAAWQELKDVGATVRFGVDATALPAALQTQQPWQVVVWNFPCTAVAAGQDGQNGAMEANKALVRTFCARVKSQELHVTHKTKPPFDQWGLVDVVTNAVSDDPWVYRGRIVLDRALWPPYVPRKALDRKSFPCHDACTYVFARASVVAAESSNTAGGWLADQLLPMTPDRLTELRAFWIQEQQTRRLLLQQRGKKRRYEKR